VRAVSEVRQDRQDAAVGVVGQGQAELGQDVADVLADSCLGDDELPSDRGVGVSFGDEGENLALIADRADSGSRRRRTSWLMTWASTTVPPAVTRRSAAMKSSTSATLSLSR
jgi:hypothetical protein